MVKRFQSHRSRNFHFPKISHYIFFGAVLIVITGFIYPIFSSELALIGKLGLLVAYLIYGIEGYFWFYNKSRFTFWSILPALAWIHFSPDITTMITQNFSGYLSNIGYLLSISSLVAIIVVIVVNCSYNKKRWLFSGAVNISVILVVITLINPISGLSVISLNNESIENTISQSSIIPISEKSLSESLVIESDTTIDKSKEELEYINKIRQSNGVGRLKFDSRVYKIAMARVNDMDEYRYMDHTNPITGSCSDSIKLSFGLSPDEYVAENAFGFDYGGHYSSGIEKQAIDSWMTSRGTGIIYSIHTQLVQLHVRVEAIVYF